MNINSFSAGYSAGKYGGYNGLAGQATAQQLAYAAGISADDIIMPVGPGNTLRSFPGYLKWRSPILEK